MISQILGAKSDSERAGPHTHRSTETPSKKKQLKVYSFSKEAISSLILEYSNVVYYMTRVQGMHRTAARNGFLYNQ